MGTLIHHISNSKVATFMYNMCVLFTMYKMCTKHALFPTANIHTHTNEFTHFIYSYFSPSFQIKIVYQNEFEFICWPFENLVEFQFLFLHIYCWAFEMCWSKQNGSKLHHKSIKPPKQMNFFPSKKSYWIKDNRNNVCASAVCLCDCLCVWEYCFRKYSFYFAS